MDVTDPFAGLFDGVFPAARAAKIRQRQSTAPKLSQEDEQTLIDQLSSAGLGGLAWLGGTLDKALGGRALRAGVGLLTGNSQANAQDLLSIIPFSDTLGITNPEQQIGGRELLDPILGPNQAGFDLGDVAGFGAEILLDPSTYLTGGALGAAKNLAGGAAKAAGLLDDAARIATKKAAGAGSVVGKHVGPHKARRTLTLRQAIDSAVDPAKAEQLAEEYLQKYGKTLADVQDDVLAPGVAHIGIPFTDIGMQVGTGRFGQKIGDALDWLGATAARGKIPGTAYSPGVHLRSLFDSTVQQTDDPAFQAVYAQELTKNQELARTKVRDAAAGLAIHSKGMAPGELRQALEVKGYQGPSELDPAIAAARTTLSDTQFLARRYGMPALEHSDTSINYSPRQGVGMSNPEVAGKDFMPFNAKTRAHRKRERYLTGIPGGTEMIRRFISEPGLSAVLEKGGKAKDVYEYIKNTHPLRGEIPPTYSYIEAGQQLEGDRYKKLASQIYKSWKQNPDAVREGWFANDPVADYMSVELRRNDAVGAGGTTLEVLSREAKPRMPGDPIPPGAMTVRQVLKKVGMKPYDANWKDASDDILEIAFQKDADLEGALWEMARRRGEAPQQAWLDELVSTDAVRNLVRMNRAFRSPEEAGLIAKGIDSFLSLFKFGVLSRPARYSRDLVSAVYANWQDGLLEAKEIAPALYQAHRMLTGNAVKGAANFPELKERLLAKNMPVNDATATDELRQIAFAHELVGHGQVTTVSQPTGTLGLSRDEISGAIPGMHPFSAVEQAKNVVGGVPYLGRKVAPNVTANPLDVRGVMKRSGEVRQQSGFGPAIASESLSHYTDGLGRLSALINQLRKGQRAEIVAPRIKAALVNYSSRALTPFERQVMTRAFPFYRWTRGVLPHTLTTLARSPGGKTSQTIQAVAEARGPDALTPDYVAESAAIPVPEGTPLIGPEEGGPPRYITGLGLPFETLAGYLGGGVRGAGLELAGGLNPLVKGPLEYFTGTSLFQKGPEGARDLEDLDPLLGRIGSNVSDMFTGQTSQRGINLPQEVEVVAANSPLSAILSSIRTLTDQRKGVIARGVNLLTGVKITDVSDAAAEANLRRLVQKAMDDMGAENFQRVYFPKDVLAKLAPEERKMAERYNSMLAELAMRQRARADKRRAEQAATQKAQPQPFSSLGL